MNRLIGRETEVENGVEYSAAEERGLHEVCRGEKRLLGVTI
jgi:hypothetical protein